MERLPKDGAYFKHFEALAGMAHTAATIFCGGTTPREKAQALFTLEDKADAVVHAVVDLLDSHRDPPLKDGSDIHALVHNIDNIVDMIEKAADRIPRYGLSYTNETLILGKLLVEATEAIKNTMPLLRTISRDHKGIKDGCIAVNDFENEGDKKHREALKDLVGTIRHQIIETRRTGNLAEDILQTVEKMWNALLTKEVLGILEYALDQCEDVANFLESLKKKNA